MIPIKKGDRLKSVKKCGQGDAGLVFEVVTFQTEYIYCHALTEGVTGVYHGRYTNDDLKRLRREYPGGNFGIKISEIVEGVYTNLDNLWDE